MTAAAPLKIALAIHELHGHGGLQRDAMRIGREALARGHRVTFLLARRPTALEDGTDGVGPGAAELRVLDARGASNHARAVSYSTEVEGRAGEYDAVLGFHCARGLDLLFAGDRCYADRVRATRPALARWTPRFRALSGLEREVFAPGSGTRILLLAEAHRAVFQRWYGTPDGRFQVLPPGVDPSRRRRADHIEARRAVRAELGLGGGDALALLVGSDFARKGLDRAIDAVAALAGRGERWTLAVAGSGAARPFERRARRAGLSVGRGEAPRLVVLGPRSDVPALLAAADVLVHPARTEAAGAVLLESLAAGTPVAASSVCGYAPWVAESGAGRVLEGGAGPAAWADAMAALRDSPTGSLARAALAHVEAHPEIFTMHARAVDAIERAAAARRRER